MKSAYQLMLSPDELRLIAAGLNELPVKTGAGRLLDRLQAEVEAQDLPAAPVMPAPAAPEEHR